jgi:dTDP-4-dehydrorhamnose reductase
MIILITGAAGQLGQELTGQLASAGRLIAVDRSSGPPGQRTVKTDLSDLSRVEILLNRMRPDLIVNAAGYTAVDRAEDEQEIAFRVNAELPGCLARWAVRNGRALLHYSTDYVFDGNSSRPYRETDIPQPLNAYGESKYAGEEAVTSSGCRHLILRTSWVYSGHGSNFVLTMLRLARQRPSLSVVSDQIGCPTWARNLAWVTGRLVTQFAAGDNGDFKDGIYHYCDADVVSWFDFARLIFDTAVRYGLLERLPEMTPVASSGFPQKAVRPLYSALDTSAIQRDYGIKPAALKSSLEACIEGIRQNEP